MARSNRGKFANVTAVERRQIEAEKRQRQRQRQAKAKGQQLQQIGERDKEGARQFDPDAPKPIGVSGSGVFLDTDEPWAQIDPTTGAARGNQFGEAILENRRFVAPKYFEGDEYGPASELTFKERAKLQREMVSRGLLERGDYTEGVWGESTATAYRGLLEYSNQTGLEAEKALKPYGEALESGLAQKPGRTPGTFVWDVYEKPDPKVSAAWIKKQLEDYIGRKPNEDEVSALVVELEGDFRNEYDVTQESNRDAFFNIQEPVAEAASAYVEGEGAAPPREVGAGRVVVAPDPKEAFLARMEERLGDVRENSEEREAYKGERVTFLDSISKMGRLIKDL